MAGKKSLKKYEVEDLRAGMVVGKAIYDNFGNTLVEEDVVLTNRLIVNLLDRCGDYVYIVEEPKPVEPEFSKVKAIRDLHVLDGSYVVKYRHVFERLQRLFMAARETKVIAANELKEIVDEVEYLSVKDYSKAITQIHNIPREGDYLVHHSIRVAILLGVMGQWLHFKPAELKKLIMAGLIYDIGKTQVPQDILDKPGKLTELEMELVQTHSSLGFELVHKNRLTGNYEVLCGILQHHERLDGSGYPENLPAEDICEFARLLAIADIYDAMAATTSYAAPKSPFMIFNTLADDMAGNKLDTKYGVLFIKHMRRCLNGNWVRLTDNVDGKIIYVDEGDMRAQPIVQTADGQFIDLNKTTDLQIANLLTYAEIV